MLRKIIIGKRCLICLRHIKSSLYCRNPNEWLLCFHRLISLSECKSLILFVISIENLHILTYHVPTLQLKIQHLWIRRRGLEAGGVIPYIRWWENNAWLVPPQTCLSSRQVLVRVPDFLSLRARWGFWLLIFQHHKIHFIGVEKKIMQTWKQSTQDRLTIFSLENHSFSSCTFPSPHLIFWIYILAFPEMISCCSIQVVDTTKVPHTVQHLVQ